MASKTENVQRIQSLAQAMLDASEYNELALKIIVDLAKDYLGAPPDDKTVFRDPNTASAARNRASGRLSSPTEDAQRRVQLVQADCLVGKFDLQAKCLDPRTSIEEVERIVASARTR